MNEQFYTIASRIIVDESSVEEQNEFLKELEKDPELAREFEEMKLTWDTSALYERPSFANEDWQILETRIHQKPKQAFLRSSWQKMALAASLALIATVSWTLWNHVFSWEHIEATAANQEVILPDMSRVVIKKGSELRYKKNFLENRSLKLEGEAWFEVTKDPGHPFTIQTKKTRTTVLGTAFDLHELNEAGDVELRVKEGKVSFQAGEASLILEEGMAACYDSKTGSLKNIPVGSENEISWVNNQLNFNNTDIVTTLNDIEHYYEIVISHSLPPDYCAFSGEYGKMSPEEMREILSEVLELEIQVRGVHWIVTKGTCR
ncbi:MAG: FecR family protein [Bacteroidia bacterium]